jgi:hypothetical protein
MGRNVVFGRARGRTAMMVLASVACLVWSGNAFGDDGAVQCKVPEGGVLESLTRLARAPVKLAPARKPARKAVLAQAQPVHGPRDNTPRGVSDVASVTEERSDLNEAVEPTSPAEALVVGEPPQAADEPAPVPGEEPGWSETEAAEDPLPVAAAQDSSLPAEGPRADTADALTAVAGTPITAPVAPVDDLVKPREFGEVHR